MDKIQAQHILVDTEDQAKDLLTQIDGGASFEDLAQKHSKCPSGQRGGQLGEFGKGQMVPEFEKAAFELNPGQVSQPVETQFGFHLIKRN